MNLTLIVGSILLAVLSWPAFRLLNNYLEARKFGIPILVTPASLLGPLWGILENRITPFLLRLPFGLGSWARHSGFGWFFKARYYDHEKYGPVFIVVTPSELVFILADAPAVDEVFSRRTDFIKSEAMYKLLEIFGPNVDTLNGEDWQRHRRLTTPPFNERNNSHVWKESLRQASEMLSSWLKIAKDGVTTTPGDSLTLALHVLTSAGLGKSYAFDGGLTKLTGSHTLSYRDALYVLLTNLMAVIFMTNIPLPAMLLPKSLTDLKRAISEFREYMVEMVEEEKATVHDTAAEKDNLLSTLVRLSTKAGGAKGRNGLSDDEIFGNLFIYNLAGHDTTANTISFALTILAAQPELQEWIREELRTVFNSEESTNTEEWQYERAFPKLTRCMALMYETLRLYGPVIMIPKYTGTTPSQLTIRGKLFLLPAKSYIIINLAGLNTMPEYWGADTLTFRPSRWIEHDASGVETLYQPPPGVFMPWAGGPRICPGKKFAQVEFTAVMAKLFAFHRVRPLVNQGETEGDARKRFMETVEDAGIATALKMNHPERVKLIWEKI